MMFKCVMFHCWFWPQAIGVMIVLFLILCAFIAEQIGGHERVVIEEIGNMTMKWLDYIDDRVQLEYEAVDDGEE